ncbi:imidazolonepropionase [Kallotenue papyrolyticum]|uniref:imidazolonepropionase n=1 Tax=Kallotenue papyrolyticum TaxID=1325125 RepID=UPI000472BC76|nr:imidazolonepropionase [Kallotenue papyrolyticum]
MTRVAADCLVTNIGQLVTVAAQAPDGLGLRSRAALAARQGRIVWIGQSADWPTQVALADGGRLIDARGCLVTPGFVDSHTHLVYAGQRAAEFHERLSGVAYTQQLGQGRGIYSTVAATRAATGEQLLAQARRRLHSCLRHGTTTIEIKTGYGLDLATEARLLATIEALRGEGPRIVATFMGAHVVAPEYRHDRAAYLRLLIDELLPAFAGRAAFCDVFCEEQAFSVAESRAILERACTLGYRLKLHANQLGPSGGAQLAAELGAVSADHLDYVDTADIAALARAGVVATLLPGCSMTLRTPYPSARPLLDAGVTVALATDFNPGTCACENMQLMIALAVLNLEMTIAEALRAATLGGAQALALADQVGSLEPGKCADLLLWDAESYLELGYRLGTNLVRAAMVDGRLLFNYVNNEL